MSRAVQQMFDGIAPTYDTLNRVLSLGIDQSWRKKAIAALGAIYGRRVLDVCAGTLDLASLAVSAGAEVVATDFSHEMLQLRPRQGARAGGARRCLGAALRRCGVRRRRLRLRAAQPRRPASRPREMRRVLGAAARLVVLDFFRPRRTVTRAVQALYNQRVLPLVGGIVSGDRSAYRYLASSIERFASRSDVEGMCRELGFASARSEDLTLGIASMVVATK